MLLELLYFNFIPTQGFNSFIDNIPKNTYTLLSNYLFNNTNNVKIEEFESSDVNSSNNEFEYLNNQSLTSNTINENEIQDESTALEEDETNVDIKDDNFQSDDENLETTPALEPITNKKLKYKVSNIDYFNNSLFIGDSRMAGFEIYKKLPGAMYFCYSSASVFNIFENSDDVSPIGNVKLFDLLSKHKFDKIYIMLGINNLQTNYYVHKKKYNEVINSIKELQPQAIIYLIANLHVADVYDPEKPHLTNDNVNLVNSFIKENADNAQTFYLDPNPMYDDEDGNLKLELSYDNIHIHIVHYDKFLVYLLSYALVEDDSDNSNVIGPK